MTLAMAFLELRERAGLPLGDAALGLCVEPGYLKKVEDGIVGIGSEMLVKARLFYGYLLAVGIQELERHVRWLK